MKQHEPLWQHILHLCKRGFAPFSVRLGKAFQKYGEINGEQCAASFAYYAFFSLFPLIVLLVAIGIFFIPDRKAAAAQVVRQIQQFVPLQTRDKAMLLETIHRVIKHGLEAGILGILTLTWSSLRFFQALVIGVNRAWGFKDYSWWRLPLKNLMMIGILLSVLLLGIVVPLVFDRIKTFYLFDLSFLIELTSKIVPVAVLFYGLLMFYKFAPSKPARVSEVWLAALLVTLFLKFGQGLFGWYLSAFAKFDALYGVFGAIMALLFWIYFSGSVILFGACIASTMHPQITPVE